MKNIHLVADFRKDVDVNPQNIYITNSEEIKEGDWYIESLGLPDSYVLVHKLSNEWKDKESFCRRCKKIILTTDPDLIKDGVQPIDDEFLEWFVKNSSCEKVETKISRYKHYYKTGEIMGSLSPVPDFLSRNMQCEKVQPIYEIIIPQEKTKPKCVAGCKHFSDGEVYHHKDCFYYRLEEAAKQSDKSKCKHFRREYTKEEVYDSFEEGFISGAKSDAAKDYLFKQFKEQ